MKSKKRILILGASGFIGRNCVEYFLKKIISLKVFILKISLNFQKK